MRHKPCLMYNKGDSIFMLSILYGGLLPLLIFYPNDFEHALHFAVVCCDFGKCLWWRHQMETFSALLAICAGRSPVTGDFPAQRPVTRSFDVFFDLRLNIRLSKQSWCWWFETPSHPLWRHCHVVFTSIFEDYLTGTVQKYYILNNRIICFRNVIIFDSCVLCRYFF